MPSRKHIVKTPTEESPMYMRPSEAARLIACSRSKIYTAIKSGQIKATRIAGLLRISRKELESFLADEASD
jgi:excisionase family DNA binding protein